MGNPYFRFKQFTVWHDRCAMKVGTDGVLLGAWAGQGLRGKIPPSGPETSKTSPGTSSDAGPEAFPRTILDIGTGSGLVALMLAQRFPGAQVTGIDIDEAAIAQARENFAGSPWPDRLRAVRQSLQEFCRSTVTGTAGGSFPRFDLIVSNPPFYDTTLTNPDPVRTAARHTGGLTHEELLLLSASLLTPQGVFSLIIPSESGKSILRLAERSRLHLHRLTRVYSKPSSRPRRILASFGRQPVSSPVEDTLTLTGTDGTRSPEHIRLTQDFYLT